METLPVAVRAAVAQFFSGHIAWLEEVLGTGSSDGSVRADLDPRAMSHAIVAMLEGALLVERLLDGATGFEMVIGVLHGMVRPAPYTTVVA